MSADRTRDLCIFTTHTPVEAAFDKFSYDDAHAILGEGFPLEELKKYAGQDRLNTTLLALNLSKYVNGVTNAHMEYSKNLFPGYHLKAITNGVHPYTWACQPFKELYDAYIPGWASEPELLVRVDEISYQKIWDAHIGAKKLLIDNINKSTEAELDVDVLTLGAARRATAYKRPALIFSDLDRLRDINRTGRVQLVFAGKAHPKDESGKRVIKEICSYSSQLRGDIEVVYLENYNMELAGRLTSIAEK